MQLSDKSGISCDYCGLQHKNDFVYFSYDCKSVDSYSTNISLDQLLTLPVTYSYDICGSCHEDFKKRIISNYAKLSPKRKRYCELSGEPISKEYYYVVVSQVTIKLSGQPNICTKCKTSTHQTNAVCSKCGGREFIKVASQGIDQRHLEINVSEKIIKDFNTKLEIQRKTAGQWTTK